MSSEDRGGNQDKRKGTGELEKGEGHQRRIFQTQRR